MLSQFADPLVYYLLFIAMLISLLAWAFEGGKGLPLDESRRAEVLAEVERLNSCAYRASGVAYERTDDAPEDIDEADETALALLGVVGIIDPPRDTAAPSSRPCIGRASAS